MSATLCLGAKAAGAAFLQRGYLKEQPVTPGAARLDFQQYYVRLLRSVQLWVSSTRPLGLRASSCTPSRSHVPVGGPG